MAQHLTPFWRFRVGGEGTSEESSNPATSELNTSTRAEHSPASEDRPAAPISSPSTALGGIEAEAAEPAEAATQAEHSKVDQNTAGAAITSPSTALGSVAAGIAEPAEAVAPAEHVRRTDKYTQLVNAWEPADFLVSELAEDEFLLAPSNPNGHTLGGSAFSAVCKKIA